MPFRAVLPPLPPDGIAEVASGSIGEMTQLVCGYLHCDQRFNPLIGALPDIMVVHPCNDGHETETSGGSALASAAIVPIQPGDWLETTLRHTVEEALGERPGNTDMLARLSEILFVEVVRRYMQQLPAAHHGWLAGVSDPVVGHVLRLLHAHPEYAWTVEDLAQCCGSLAVDTGPAIHGADRRDAYALPGDLAHSTGEEPLEADQPDYG